MESSVGNNVPQNRRNPIQEPGGICNYFRGRTVLVTGATGFLGKALVEKLLRSCQDVEKIFLLVRPKHGLDVASRFKDFIRNPIFDRVRSECPDQLSKLQAVSGDALRPNLGLSDEDQALLSTEVGVVFHTAATVRFNEPLKLAVMMNTQGTRRVIDLCRKMNKLTAFVHVSTAYSNADKREIREEVYPPPADPDTMIKFVTATPSEILDAVESRLIGDHPNTYTFTKAMAESIVQQEAACLPTAIVRPSIVTAACHEPSPGWVDNVSGITGICMEVGRGTVRSVLCDKKLVVDLVPVDVVVNTLLAAAAHLHYDRPSHMPVFNCTSGGDNPLLWDDLRKHVLTSARDIPSKYVQWYPGCTFRVNRLLHRLAQIFLHALPAFVLDILLRVKGLKPIMMRICERTRRSAVTGEFFSSNEWNFESVAMRNLAKSASIDDKKRFPMDMCSWSWKKYIHTYMLGIRQFVLKDDLTSLPAARNKLAKLYWGQRIIQGIALLLFIKYGISS